MVIRANLPPRKDEEHRRQIDRALAALETALCCCREEDVRYTTGAIEALSFLERLADEQWPFEQFREALADPGMETTQPEARWQSLNAALNGIKRAVGRKE